MDPTQVRLTRRQLLHEEAFRQLELEGDFLPNRADDIRSLVSLLHKLLFEHQSKQPFRLSQELLETGLRLKSRSNQQEKKDPFAKRNEETRLFFSALMAMYGGSQQTIPNPGESS